MTRDEKRMLIGLNSAIGGYIRAGIAVVILPPESILDAIHHPGKPQCPKFGVVLAAGASEALISEEKKVSEEPLQTVYSIRRLRQAGNCEICRCQLCFHGVIDAAGNIVPDEALCGILTDYAHATLRNALYAHLLCRTFLLYEEQDEAVNYVIDCLLTLQ